MSVRTRAMRIGVDRGWIEFLKELRNPGDLGFYLVTSSGALTYLYLNRHEQMPGTNLLLPSVMLPSLLGALVAFGGVIGVAYSLAAEREDGTLLRAKAIPHGMIGYLTAHVVRTSLGAVPALSLVLLPGLFLFDGLVRGGPAGLLTLGWVLVLGLVAALPIGMIIGSLVTFPRQVGSWGILPIGGLAAISGIFYPFSLLPGWVQDVGQVFPMYWLGLGMRSAFLPEEAAAAEIGGSWRSLETAGVLSAWAVAGLLIAPVVLRRMARRESGSKVDERREQVMRRLG
jgi:ABC-2 type transport system permease protein